MSKILGIQSVVHGGVYSGAPSFIQRAQSVSFMGNNYEHAGEAERKNAPYYGQTSLGGADAPYSLAVPGAVREVKAALIALAQDRADKLSGKWKDPATETIWKYLVLNDVWDEHTADEFTAAVSRLNQETWGNWGPAVQQTEIGPQPTPRGLELIAGGVERLLNGQPAMEQYLSWRDSTTMFPVPDPPAWLYISSDAKSVPTGNFGPSFLRLPVDTTGAVKEELDAIAKLEVDIVSQISKLLVAKNEPERHGRLGGLFALRGTRKAMIAKVRSDIQKAPCLAQPGHTWDATIAKCVAPPPVPVTPPKSAGTESDDTSTMLWLGVGALAIGAFWYSKKTR